MRFAELPVAVRPNSEAGSTRSQAAASVQQDLIKTVIERWRSATMNYKGVQEIDVAEATRVPSATPAAAAAHPGAQPQLGSTLDSRRQTILRRPLDAAASPADAGPGNFRSR